MYISNIIFNLKKKAPQEVIANPNVTVTNTLVAVSNKLVAAQK